MCVLAWVKTHQNVYVFKRKCIHVDRVIMLQFLLLICTCSLKELCTNWSEQKYQNKHTTLTVFNYWIFKFGNISDGDQEENSHIFLVFNRSNVEQIPHRCAYNKYKRRLLIRYTAKNVQVATSLLTSCDNLSQQADLRMRSHGLRQLVHDSLFTTSLLQVVNRLVAS